MASRGKFLQTLKRWGIEYDESEADDAVGLLVVGLLCAYVLTIFAYTFAEPGPPLSEHPLAEYLSFACPCLAGLFVGLNFYLKLGFLNQSRKEKTLYAASAALLFIGFCAYVVSHPVAGELGGAQFLRVITGVVYLVALRLFYPRSTSRMRLLYILLLLLFVSVNLGMLFYA